MCSYSSVAHLARLMRIEPAALLARLAEAGVEKTSGNEPLTAAETAALSAFYKRSLGRQGNGAEPVSEARETKLVRIEAEFRNSYIDYCLRVLGGQVFEDEESGALIVEVPRGGVREWFADMVGKKGDRIRLIIALARLRISSAAKDVESCLRADRDAKVDPAFAPPHAVI